MSYYLDGLPVQAVKVLAGFSIRDGDYFIIRAAIEPPEELKRLVFPEIDDWLQKFYAGVVQQDTAGPNFLTMMKCLRTVFLQVTTLFFSNRT